jgi:molybdate transport system substrate-binding protein
LLTLAAILFVAGPAVAAPPLRVAAASDMARILEKVGAEWQKKTGQEVKVSLAATAVLLRQLLEGAPFDVFLSADEEAADKAIAAEVCAADSRVIYAHGRLVAWSASGAPSSLAALAEPRYRRIAIANPEHAPYGRAARACLEHANMWSTLKHRIVIAESVLQALQYAKSGNADVALVARSLVDDGLVIEESLHGPILQAGVACGHDAARLASAREFLKFLVAEVAKAK